MNKTKSFESFSLLLTFPSLTPTQCWRKSELHPTGVK